MAELPMNKSTLKNWIINNKIQNLKDLLNRLEEPIGSIQVEEPESIQVEPTKKRPSSPLNAFPLPKKIKLEIKEEPLIEDEEGEEDNFDIFQPIVELGEVPIPEGPIDLSYKQKLPETFQTSKEEDEETDGSLESEESNEAGVAATATDPDLVKLFQCDVCNIRYTTRARVNRHIFNSIIHQKNYKDIYQASPPPKEAIKPIINNFISIVFEPKGAPRMIPKRFPVTPMDFYCDLCKSSFNTKRHYHRHVYGAKSHKAIYKKKFGQSPPPKTPKVISNRPRPWTCITCNAFFFDRDGLKTHFQRTAAHKGLENDPAKDESKWFVGEVKEEAEEEVEEIQIKENLEPIDAKKVLVFEVKEE